MKKGINFPIGTRCHKQVPDLDLKFVFDDIEDDIRIRKNEKKFIPIEEIGTNEFNPEEIFLEREANGFAEDDEEIFKIFQPEAEIDFSKLEIDDEDDEYDEDEEEEIIKKWEKLPQQIGVGKLRALARH